MCNRSHIVWRTTLLVAFLLVLMVPVEVCAAGESYPSKPIKLIVPFNPGGLSDTTARVVVKHMDKYFDQPLVVVNIEGAGSIVGSQEALEAPADGYTLLWHHHSMLTSNVMGLADFTWDSYTPVCSVVSTGATVVVKATSPWNTLKDLLDDAREHPGKIRYGVNLGTMSHFGGLNLGLATGVKFSYVGGGGDAVRIAQLLRGEIDVCASGGLTVQYVRSGELRPLAYASDKRNPALPEVPTTIEQDVDSVEIFTLGIFGPKGLPKDIVEKLEKAFAMLCEDSSFKEEMRSHVCEVTYMPSDVFGEYLDSEQIRLQEVAERSGILRK